MNYTNTIRDYLEKHMGGFFELTNELKERLTMFNPKTMMKILNRLELEGLAEKIGKGFYYIRNNDVFSVDKFITYYSSNYRGLLLGYRMFNRYGISDYNDEQIIIYTNNIGMNKNVYNVSLRCCDIGFIGHYEEALIQALYTIECGFNKIIGCNISKTVKQLEYWLYCYRDSAFKEIISKMHFQNRTIVTLNKMLKDLKIKNECINIFMNM